MSQKSDLGVDVHTARVILFKTSGKYYTEEDWRIPDKAIGPWDMGKSPDYRTIDGGPVLVETQEPWGFPHLIVTGRGCTHLNDCVANHTYRGSSFYCNHLDTCEEEHE